MEIKKIKLNFKLQYYPDHTGIVDNEDYSKSKKIVDDSTYETIPQKLARMRRGIIS